MRISLLDAAKSVSVMGRTLTFATPYIDVDKVALLNSARVNGPGTSSDLEDLRRLFQGGLIKIVDNGRALSQFDDLFAVGHSTVANLATLSLLPIEDVLSGSQIYVESLRALFTLDKTSVAVADGITVVASNLGGRWFRVVGVDSRWANQDTWFIDPVNGNNEANGLTALTAIKTFAEWKRRCEAGLIVKSSNYTISILSSLAADDYFDFDIQVLPSARFKVIGTRAVLRSGTLTAAATRNPAANTAQTVTDGTLDWAPYVGKWVRLPVSGAGFWIAKSVSPGVARIVTPALFGVTPGSCTEFVPVGTEAYEVYSLPVCRVNKGFTINGNGTTGSTINYWFENVDITGTANPNGHWLNLQGGASGTMRGCGLVGVRLRSPRYMEGCKLDNSNIHAESQNAVYQGCLFFNNVAFRDEAAHRFDAVGSLMQGGTYGAIVSTRQFTVNTTDLGVFDFSSGGLALFQGEIRIGSSASAKLYGTGTGYGVIFSPLTKMSCASFAKATLTGATADFNFGNATSHLPNIIASAGAVLPAAAPLTTWAQLVAAPFNGSCLSYKDGAYLGPTPL